MLTCLHAYMLTCLHAYMITYSHAYLLTLLTYEYNFFQHNKEEGIVFLAPKHLGALELRSFSIEGGYRRAIMLIINGVMLVNVHKAGKSVSQENPQPRLAANKSWEIIRGPTLLLLISLA